MSGLSVVQGGCVYREVLPYSIYIPGMFFVYLYSTLVHTTYLYIQEVELYWIPLVHILV